AAVAPAVQGFCTRVGPVGPSRLRLGRWSGRGAGGRGGGRGRRGLHARRKQRAIDLRRRRTRRCFIGGGGLRGPEAGPFLGPRQLLRRDRNEELIQLGVIEALPARQRPPHRRLLEVDVDAFSHREELGIAVLRHGIPRIGGGLIPAHGGGEV